MNKILILLFCVIQFGYSQTKLIAHKSHSGTNNTFSKAIEKHSILSSSGFGIKHGYKVVEIRIDTLKYTNNSLIGVYKNKANSILTEKIGLKDNDLASAIDLFRSKDISYHRDTVVFENFEIKDTTAYYDAKYNYFFLRKRNKNKIKLKLDSVKRISNKKIVLITGKKSDTLKVKIKEISEIKWLANKDYDTSNTIFIGFTKPKKERFRTI